MAAVQTLEELINNPDVKAQAEAAGKEVAEFASEHKDQLLDLINQGKRAVLGEAEQAAPAAAEKAGGTVADAVQGKGPAAGMEPPPAPAADEAAPAQVGAPPPTPPSTSMSPIKKASLAGAAGGAALAATGDESTPEETAAPTPPPAKPAAAAPTSAAPAAKPTSGPGSLAKAAAVDPDQAEEILDKSKDGIADAPRDFKSEFKAIQDLQDDYRKEFKEANDRIEQKELAEKMGHALAQLGAGYQGLKTGIDMSTGVKFDKTDWGKRMQIAQEELRDNLADIRSRRQTTKQEELTTQQEAARSKEHAETLAVKQSEGTKERANRLDIAKQANITKENVAGTKAGAAADKLENKADQEAQQAVEGINTGLDAMENGSDKKARDAGAASVLKWSAVAGKHLGPETMSKVREAMKSGFGDSLNPWAPSNEERRQGVSKILDDALTARKNRGIAPAPAASAPVPSRQSVAQPDPDDQKALKWLQANPNSPDAPGMKAKLQAKGLI